MNLNKQQIEALVELLYDKEASKMKKENAENEKRQNAELESKMKPLIDFYKTIPKDLINAISAYGGSIENKLRNQLKKNEKNPSPDKNAIRNKIIIASIDSVTLDELKGKLKVTF